MSRIIDMLGKRFGRLRVTAFAHAHPPRRQAHWHVLCDCGAITIVAGYHLRSGHSTSCGCRSVDAGVERLVTHGDYGSVENATWRRMLDRCYNPHAPLFHRYGGRGIAVCERWRTSYAAFLSDMGRRPGGCTSIDRIDNDGDYEPANCRWATATEQARNQSTNIRLTLDGLTLPQSAWAEQLGIGASTIRMRLRRGWTVKRALTQSVGPNGGRRVVR